ncbi:DNA-directed RNA polymerase, partial [Paramicrosporidium saccamoebae]
AEFEWDRDGTIRRTGPVMQEIQAKELGAMVRSRPLEELLPMATTLVAQGKIELAEAVIKWIKKLHLPEWYKHRDASCANTFMLAHIRNNNPDGMQNWRESLFERSHAQPDTISYGILFDYFLEKGMEGECLKLAQQMPLDCVTIEKIAESEYLSAKKMEKLCGILNIPKVKDDKISLESLVDDLDIGVKSPLRSFDKDIPEVNAIKSKSDGISFLKDSIKILREDPNADLYLVQERLERDCYTATTQKLRSELENYVKATKATIYSVSAKKLMSQWQVLLSKHIRSSLLSSANLHETAARPIKIGSGILFSSLLSAVEPEKIALISLQELTRSASYDLGVGGIPLVRLAMSIANSLEREVFAQQICKKNFLEHTKLSAKHLEKIFRNRGLFEVTMRKQYAALERNVDALRDGWIPRWTQKVKSELGVYIVSLALEALKFTEASGVSVPAFTHKVQYQNGQSLGIVGIHPELFKMMGAESASPFVEPWSMPMLVPPKPWITYNSGGYLTQRTACVRFKDDPLHLALVHQADKDGRLERILCGLDALGRTSWRINEGILKVALEMWNSGVNVSTLEEPFVGGMLEFRSKDSFPSHEEYVKYVREATERKDIISKSHSTMCDTNYKLEIARQFVGLSFYLPHSVDFRGRAYPIPPHLSHVGSDMSRGLMVFAEGKPLGKRGLRWLKIQLANMAGFDKASLDEREAYANEHLEDVFDSADRPLTGRQWWKRADEPWQCLATSMELTAALRSPDPELYVSHLPCQQDGSCNGLQHYAALGGDVDGAKQVNLSPSDRPQDVYAAVAKLVAAQIETDAVDPKHIAAKLVGRINRKIVKQTVMTNVYGVTMYGARQQIQDRLKEFNVVDPKDYKEARVYLAKAVFTSLGTLFDNAQRIQTWLTDTAMEISKAVPPEVADHFGIAVEHGVGGEIVDPPRRGPGWQMREDPADRYPQTSVYWTTPLGFQITFASVHDCFWTHASTVDQMNTILREEFVKLHSQPILANLRDELVERYRKYVIPEGLTKGRGPTGDIRHIQVSTWRPINIPPIPPKGDFDIRQVLQSDYFFS